MTSPIFISRAGLLLGCLLCACAQVGSMGKTSQTLTTADNQAGIWREGVALYAKGQYLAAADLFQMANRLKPVERISQNTGMAYLKSAQSTKYPGILRLEYARRALSHLKSYRTWLTTEYSRTHAQSATEPVQETNQRIAEAQSLEQELRAIFDRS